MKGFLYYVFVTLTSAFIALLTVPVIIEKFSLTGGNDVVINWPLFMAILVVMGIVLSFLYRSFFGVKSQTRRLFLRDTVAGFFIQFFVFTTIFSICELQLRKNGLVPGMFNREFVFRDSLVVEPYYISDSNGMIILDHRSHQWETWSYSINSQGFRSDIEYTRHAIDSLKDLGERLVAIIGDSHTEGRCASSVSLSYPDLIDNTPRLKVLNFGVGGTDPVQYWLVAKTYLPVLLPDHVIVTVCLETDLMFYDRIPQPGIPLYYTTNAGWISSQAPVEEGGRPNEVFRSAEDAYDHYLENYSLFGGKQTIAKSISRRMALTTWVYRLVAPSSKESISAIVSEAGGSFTSTRLKMIAALCDSLDIQLTIAAIPPVRLFTGGVDSLGMQSYLHDVFGEMDYAMPDNIEFSDYYRHPITSEPDIHFNDSGHRKLADFLLESILLSGD